MVAEFVVVISLALRLSWPTSQGDTEIKFANDKLKSVSISDDSLDNLVNSDQQTTSKQWTSDHSLSRQEAKLQLRQAGKGSERSNDERNENPRRDSPDHQALTGQPNVPGHGGWSTINQSPGLATRPKEAASSKQATATVGLSKESTGSPRLTVHPAKTAEEEWSWPIGELLTMQQQAQLIELLDNFKDIFAFSMKERTTVPGVEFEIPVSDETPIFKHQYRLAHSEKEDLAQQVAENSRTA